MKKKRGQCWGQNCKEKYVALIQYNLTDPSKKMRWGVEMRGCKKHFAYAFEHHKAEIDRFCAEPEIELKKIAAPFTPEVPDQKDCVECRSIRLGEPRCRWCLDKIYIHSVTKLKNERDELARRLKRAIDALRFYKSDLLADELEAT